MFTIETLYNLSRLTDHFLELRVVLAGLVGEGVAQLLQVVAHLAVLNLKLLQLK